MSPATTQLLQSRRRRTGGGGGGGGALSFLGQSSFARPTPGTPAAASAAGWNLVPCLTKSDFTTAIAAIASHQYIYYNGTVPLDISSSSATAALSINGRNPSAMAVIDFGCSKNMWDTSKVTNGYVRFTNTYSAQTTCLYVFNSSNIAIYGGDVSCDHGYGIELDKIQNIVMWDQYVHNVGGSGVWGRDDNYITNCDFRVEVNRFCMDPSKDSHNDKGTGHHGMILHGAGGGSITGNRWICSAHDPLRPGEVSFGQTWTEGSGGSGIEHGSSLATGGLANNTFYLQAYNMLMTPNGTNPGSTTQQTGGNGALLYGSSKQDGNIWAWLELSNSTGAAMHVDNSSFAGISGASPPVTVTHGRYHNINQWTGNSSMSGVNAVPFNLVSGIVYNDNQAF